MSPGNGAARPDLSLAVPHVRREPCLRRVFVMVPHNRSSGPGRPGSTTCAASSRRPDKAWRSLPRSPAPSRRGNSAAPCSAFPRHSASGSESYDDPPPARTCTGRPGSPRCGIAMAVFVASPCQADVTDRASNRPLDRFQLVRMISIADLRARADRAGRERHAQHVHVSSRAWRSSAGPLLTMCITWLNSARSRTVATSTVPDSHAAHVVAAEVDQHQVLGAFLGDRPAVRLPARWSSFAVCRGRVAGDRATVTAAVLNRTRISGEEPTTGVAPVSRKHQRGGDSRAQGAVHVHRAGAERHASAAGDGTTWKMSPARMVAWPFHHASRYSSREAADEIRSVQRRGSQHFRICRAGAAQAMKVSASSRRLARASACGSRGSACTTR